MKGRFSFLPHGFEREAGTMGHGKRRLSFDPCLGGGFSREVDLVLEVFMHRTCLFELRAYLRQLGFGRFQACQCPPSIVPRIVEGIHRVIP